MTIKFPAALPSIKTAIMAGGQEGDACRIQFDAYVTYEQLSEMYRMRGKELTVTVESDIGPNLAGTGTLTVSSDSMDRAVIRNPEAYIGESTY